MKIKLFLLLFIFTSLFLTGCKDEKSLDSLEVVKPQLIESFFKVSVNTITRKDDDFSLFYTTDGSTDFKIAPIWQALKGQETAQTTIYNLPEGVYPTQLRLDFGLKNDQEDIVLKSVVMEYKGNKREISGTELGSFFRADENKCTFDPATGIIKAVVKAGKRQYPSLYPLEKVLGPEILKLSK